MDKPLDICSEKQLFFDDYCIEDLSGVRRQFHQAKKHPANPLMASGDPNNLMYLYGTVIHDKEQRQFQMWYHQRYMADDVVCNCHATSRDGIHWEKSKLNFFKHDKVDVSSAFLVGHYVGPTVFHTPDDPDPERRYRMLIYLGSDVLQAADPDFRFICGYGVLFSPDGVHWKEYEHNPVIQGGDIATCCYDPVSKEYIAFPKVHRTDDGIPRRCVGVSTSKDFLRWGASDIVLSADKVDDARVEVRLERFRDILRMDEPAYYSADMYGMTGFRYEGLRLGLIWFYDRVGRRSMPLGQDDDGIISIQLAYSRHPSPYGYWHRAADRQDFIPCGNEGDYDAGMIFTAHTVLEVGDELWFYYSGFDRGHGWELSRPETEKCHSKIPARGSSINLATLRRDGFMSIDSYYDLGTLTTKLLTFAGNDLEINADAEKGYIQVEFLDEQGKPVPGFTRDECVPFSGDKTGSKVIWKSGADLSALQGKPVRLIFHMVTAKLYAFCFV